MSSFAGIVSTYQELLTSTIPFLRKIDGPDQLLNHCQSLLMTLGPITNHEEYADDSIGHAAANDLFRKQAAVVTQVQHVLQKEVDRLKIHRHLAQDPEGAQAVANSLDREANYPKQCLISSILPLQLTNSNLQLLDQVCHPDFSLVTPQAMLQTAPRSYQGFDFGTTWSAVWAYTRLVPDEEDRTTSRVSRASEANGNTGSVGKSSCITEHAPECQAATRLRDQEPIDHIADEQRRRHDGKSEEQVSRYLPDVPTTPRRQITPLLPTTPSAPRKHKIEKRYIPRRGVSHWIRRISEAKEHARKPLEELDIVANQ